MDSFTYDPKKSWADIQEEEEELKKHEEKNLSNINNVQSKRSTYEKYTVPRK